MATASSGSSRPGCASSGRSSSATGASRTSRRGSARGPRAARAPHDWASGADRSFRRQHARGRGHRGRQGRGPAAPRVQRQHASASATWWRASAKCRTRPSTPWSRTISTSTTSRRSCRPGGERATSLRDGARIELGLRRFLEERSVHRVHRHVRGPARPGAAARPRGAAPHGRWVRLRRRGRLEDGGDGPGHESHERRRSRAACRSWRTTPTTWIRRATWSSAHTCWRSARPSPPAGRDSRSTRLSIGGKADPVRLVFDAHPGTAIAACVTDMGDRFRMVASVVDVDRPPQPLPKLPVARAVWRPRPDLQTNASAWIQAGGSHHTSLGYDVTADQLSDFAAMCRTELLVIDDDDPDRGLPRRDPLERRVPPPGDAVLSPGRRTSVVAAARRFRLDVAPGQRLACPLTFTGTITATRVEALRSTDVAGPEDFVPDVDPTEQVTGPASDRHIRRSGCP